jgi:hypothetical protein
MGDIVRMEHYQECTGLYVFADLRGFTAWSQKNQSGGTVNPGG